MSTILSAILGVILISLVLLDAFETVVFPRRVTRRLLRLTRAFYLYSWSLWASVVSWALSGEAPGKPLERLRSHIPSDFDRVMGRAADLRFRPLVLGLWTLGQDSGNGSGIRQSFYFSATTFFTLGLGGTIRDHPPRASADRHRGRCRLRLSGHDRRLPPGLEPVFFQARGQHLPVGMPRRIPPSAAEILRRNITDEGTRQLERLLHDWEYWAAGVTGKPPVLSGIGLFSLSARKSIWPTALRAPPDTTITIEADCGSVRLNGPLPLHDTPLWIMAFLQSRDHQLQKIRLELPPATLELLLTALSETA